MYLRSVALTQYSWLDVVGKSGNIAEYSKKLVRNTNSSEGKKNMGFCCLYDRNFTQYYPAHRLRDCSPDKYRSQSHCVQ